MGFPVDLIASLNPNNEPKRSIQKVRSISLGKTSSNFSISRIAASFAPMSSPGVSVRITSNMNSTQSTAPSSNVSIPERPSAMEISKGSFPGGRVTTRTRAPLSSKRVIARRVAACPAASPSNNITISLLNRTSVRARSSFIAVPDVATTFSIPTCHNPRTSK